MMRKYLGNCLLLYTYHTHLTHAAMLSSYRIDLGCAVKTIMTRDIRSAVYEIDNPIKVQLRCYY